MYQRGDQVLVEGFGGRRAVLRVWEDRGAGLALTSESGFARLESGDLEAPIVGYPRGDVRGLAESSSASSTAPQPPALQWPTAPRA
jgi:hypothetical protein